MYIFPWHYHTRNRMSFLMDPCQSHFPRQTGLFSSTDTHTHTHIYIYFCGEIGRNVLKLIHVFRLFAHVVTTTITHIYEWLPYTQVCGIKITIEKYLPLVAHIRSNAKSPRVLACSFRQFVSCEYYHCYSYCMLLPYIDIAYHILLGCCIWSIL